ncbi:MAG: TolC family protein [Planctomycetota bacterium]
MSRALHAAHGIGLCCLFGAAPIACSPTHYASSADDEVHAILREREREVLGSREADVQHPTPPDEEGQGPPLESPPGPAPGAPEPLVFGLAESLRQSTAGNREYKTRRESVYLQGLGLSLARYNFGPVFRSTLATLWTDPKNQAKSLVASGDLGVSQILATGGQVSLGGALSHTTLANEGSSTGDEGFATDVSLNLTQPLLRGAGYQVSHEPLTQAERDLVYAIRDFELFREQFTITIANSYWGLVSQQRQLVNAEENFRNFVKLREQSEAMRKVGRNSEQDVFLARRQELQRENDVVSARQSFQSALDRFKIDLGLPTEAPLTLREEVPEQVPVRIVEDEAIAVALHNRLDLMTESQRLEDAERTVAITENSLLPDLNLSAGYGATGPLNKSLRDALPDDRTTTVGLSLELPLNRTAERNSYRAALIRRDEAQRSYSLAVDQLGLQVRSDLRELNRISQQIVIQNDTIKSEEKALAITRIRYENGSAGSRDVTEAQQGLLAATNQLIQLQVDYAIARLNLLKDLGLLFLDAEGMWQA